MIKFKHVFAFGLVTGCLVTSQMQAGRIDSQSKPKSAFFVAPFFRTIQQSPVHHVSPRYGFVSPARSLTPAGDEFFQYEIFDELQGFLNKYKNQNITKEQASRGIRQIQTRLNNYVSILDTQIEVIKTQRQTIATKIQTKEIYTQLARIADAQAQCLEFLHDVRDGNDSEILDHDPRLDTPIQLKQ
jgi:hypothetical protein